MTGISTGVSLLMVNPSITLRDGLLGYWDFENTLNSYTGTTPYVFKGVIDTGTNDPSKDISYSVGGAKVGSYKVETLAYNVINPDGYFAAIAPNISMSKSRGTFVGWVKVVGTGSNTYACSFPRLESSSGAVNMGLSINGSPITGTSIGVKFHTSGSNLINIDPTQWNFVCYWYDFSDTSQGANGSQYFQINNGTVFAAQTPTAPSISVTVLAAPSFGYTGTSNANYSSGADADAVGLYDRVLSSTERSNLYNSGSGLSYSQLY